MAEASIKRRARNSLVEPSGLMVEIEADNHERLRQLARAKGISMGAVVDMLLDRLDVDAQGEMFLGEPRKKHVQVDLFAEAS